MNTPWEWGGRAILQAGLVVCLAAGAWAGDRTTFGSQDDMPRVLHPAPDDAHATADQQDPPPPTPPEFSPIFSKTERTPRSGDQAQPATPLKAGGESGSSTCDAGCAARGSAWSRWF